MRRSALIPIVALGACTLTTTMGLAANAAPATSSPEPVPVVSDQSAEAPGEPTPISLTEFDTKIAPIIYDNPADFGGAYYSADGQVLTITVARPASRHVQEVRSAISAAKLNGRVQLKVVRNSYQDLKRLEARVMSANKGQVALTAVDPKSNRLVVEVKASQPSTQLTLLAARSRGSKELSKALASNSGVQELAKLGGSQILFDADTSDTEFTVSRGSDKSPHRGGASYGWGTSRPSTKVKAVCTLGFPVKYKGHTYGVTAGHCKMTGNDSVLYSKKKSTAYSPGGTSSSFKLGTVNSSTWNTPAFRANGDLMLLNGSYKAAIYNKNSSTLKIKSGYWYPLPGDAQLCMSGMTSGQVCRFRVKYGDAIGPNGNRHQIGVYHDPYLKRSPDCIASQGGDSGGPWYRAVTGGVQVVGIGSGTESRCNLMGPMAPGRQSIGTNLIGLKKWKPGVSVVTS